jgi:hypothetical protein
MAQYMEIISVRPGKEKPVYMRIGVMFPAKDGKEGYSIKLDALPLPNEKGEIWLSVRPPFEKDAAPRSVAPSRRESFQAPNDDIPF